jgi:hypothetical protein
LGGDQRLDLARENPDRELGAARKVYLGLVCAPISCPIDEALDCLRFALSRRRQGRIAPAGTCPVPPTVSSAIRMVG